MSFNTQLLCTFTSVTDVESVLDQIEQAYEIAEPPRIYILEQIDQPENLYCTYNVVPSNEHRRALPATISLHRKKATNTLYTINALNLLIKELNNGIIDPKFIIEWGEYRNTILLSVDNTLKKIQTKLLKIITI